MEHGFAGESWINLPDIMVGGYVRKGERGTRMVYAGEFVLHDRKR